MIPEIKESKQSIKASKKRNQSITICADVLTSHKLWKMEVDNGVTYEVAKAFNGQSINVELNSDDIELHELLVDENVNIALHRLEAFDLVILEWAMGIYQAGGLGIDILELRQKLSGSSQRHKDVFYNDVKKSLLKLRAMNVKITYIEDKTQTTITNYLLPMKITEIKHRNSAEARREYFEFLTEPPLLEHVKRMKRPQLRTIPIELMAAGVKREKDSTVIGHYLAKAIANMEYEKGKSKKLRSGWNYISFDTLFNRYIC